MHRLVLYTEGVEVPADDQISAKVFFFCLLFFFSSKDRELSSGSFRLEHKLVASPRAGGVGGEQEAVAFGWVGVELGGWVFSPASRVPSGRT